MKNGERREKKRGRKGGGWNKHWHLQHGKCSCADVSQGKTESKSVNELSVILTVNWTGSE